MRNTIKCSIAAAVLALGALQANAIQHEVINWHNVHVNEGQTVTGSFDITDAPVWYNTASEQILSASLAFYFKDDSYFDSQEYARVTVDGSWFGDTAVGNQLANLPWSFFDIFGSVSGAVSMNQDGQLNYSVTALDNGVPGRRFGNGDFIFTKAVLEVEIGQRANVPDGGATIALLGLGLLGASALRRKR